MTDIIKCKVCGGDVLPPRIAYCSDACAKEGKRRQKRVDNPRKSPGGKLYIERTCQDCGRQYIGHIKSLRCPDCQSKSDRHSAAEYRQRIAHGQTRKLGSTDFCEMCGAPYIVNSGRQRYCKACAVNAVRENTRAHKRAWNRAYYADTDNRERKNSKRRGDWQTARKCIVCGVEFIPTSPAQTICGDVCRIIQKRNQQRAADAKRRSKKEN